jgi:quercetin dioxygenase-like cupin family protein
MRRVLMLTVLIAVEFSDSACQYNAAKAEAGMHGGHVTAMPADLKWRDADSLKGAKIAVLEGDMSKPGYFCARVLLPDGLRVPPHWHPNAERVTILQGTLYLGEGDSFDQSKGTALPAGAYSSMPAGMRHYAWAKGETILQINTIGPWGITYVNPADDPRNKTASK